MKILARKNLGFRNPQTDEILKVKENETIELPEWAEKDPMFYYATKDQLIEFLSKESEQKADAIKKDKKLSLKSE